MIREQRAAVMD